MRASSNGGAIRVGAAGACLLALWLVQLFGLPAAATATSEGEPDLKRVDAFVREAMRDRGIPGAALVVVDDGKIVHARGFGRADARGRPVTPQTPFRIGSSTKSFTALAVMQLVEEGKIDLDAPVRRYLPWFRVADPDASARITVAHLLYHTSGIPGEANAASLADPAPSLEQNVRALRDVVPDRPAGSSFAYSNPNYDALGLIVERVSGQPYADYVRRHILDPLDMRHSFATPMSMGRGRLAAGHQWFFGVPRATPDRFIPGQLPAGFLSASAEDMGRYLIAQMNGGRYGNASVLSPEGIAALHTPGPNAEIPASALAGGTGGGYAMGWIDGEVYGVPAVWHNGDDSRNGSLMVLSEKGWGMALLVNSSNPLSDLEPTEYLASGVTRLLAGKEPVPTGMPSIGRTYLAFDAVLLALSVPVAAAALLMPRWYRNLRRRLPGRPPWRTALSALRAAAEVLLATGVLLLVPWWIGSWSLLSFGVPDLAWWLAAASGVLMATGLARGALLARVQIRAGRTGAGKMTASPPMRPRARG
jgi:CubicO group peptidase (beta-lactamase class C family)